MAPRPYRCDGLLDMPVLELGARLPCGSRLPYAHRFGFAGIPPDTLPPYGVLPRSDYQTRVCSTTELLSLIEGSGSSACSVSPRNRHFAQLGASLGLSAVLGCQR